MIVKIHSNVFDISIRVNKHLVLAELGALLFIIIMLFNAKQATTLLLALLLLVVDILFVSLSLFADFKMTKEDVSSAPRVKSKSPSVEPPAEPEQKRAEPVKERATKTPIKTLDIPVPDYTQEVKDVTTSSLDEEISPTLPDISVVPNWKDLLLQRGDKV